MIQEAHENNKRILTSILNTKKNLEYQEVQGYLLKTTEIPLLKDKIFRLNLNGKQRLSELDTIFNLAFKSCSLDAE